MTELEKIAYAKSFIDKMANGVNPLDDAPIPEGDLLNQVRISRCMFYVSDILRQVIENGGITAGSMAPPFRATAEELKAVKPAPGPLSVTLFCERISAPFAGNGRKRLYAGDLSGALTQMGYLESTPGGDGKTQRRPTALGASVGILLEDRVGKNGLYHALLYSPAAQQFVLDHFDEIQPYMDRVREARKSV